jgi:hypothetical protein
LKTFSIECSPEPKYEKVFQAIVQRIQNRSAHDFNVKSFRKNPREDGMRQIEGQQNKAGGMPASVRISGEIIQSNFSSVTGILAELAMVACEFDSKINGGGIGFVTGNLFSQNQKIPVFIPREPEIREGVALDVFHTIQDRDGKSTLSRLLTKKGQAPPKRDAVDIGKHPEKERVSPRPERPDLCG